MRFGRNILALADNDGDVLIFEPGADDLVPADILDLGDLYRHAGTAEPHIFRTNAEFDLFAAAGITGEGSWI